MRLPNGFSIWVFDPSSYTISAYMFFHDFGYNRTSLLYLLEKPLLCQINEMFKGDLILWMLLLCGFSYHSIQAGILIVYLDIGFDNENHLQMSYIASVLVFDIFPQ